MPAKSGSPVATIVARGLLLFFFYSGAACTGDVAPKSEMTHDQKDPNTRL